jgi:hypothetical protein
VLKSHIGGPLQLTKSITSMSDYDANDQDVVDKCTERAFSQLLAFTYLDNSDKAKYGSLLIGLQTQQSLKNNQYPPSITEANNVLSNHRFDNAGKVQNNSKTTPSKYNKETNKDEEKPEMSFAMMKGKCYCCGKGGHKSPTCRMKAKIPKDEWAK